MRLLCLQRALRSVFALQYAPGTVKTADLNVPFFNAVVAAAGGGGGDGAEDLESWGVHFSACAIFPRCSSLAGHPAGKRRKLTARQNRKMIHLLPLHSSVNARTPRASHRI